MLGGCALRPPRAYLQPTTAEALRLYQDALVRAKEAAQVERLKGKVHSLEAAARSEGTGL